MTKRCAECGKRKPSTEFNRNTSKPDGLQHCCRQCSSDYNRRRYQEKRNHIRTTVAAYREANPDKIREAKRAWKKTDAGKATQRRYRERHHETIQRREAERRRRAGMRKREQIELTTIQRQRRLKARRAVSSAIRTGKLTRGECEHAASGECVGRIESHHDSYAERNWLKVRWLCVRHHNDEHADEV